MNTMTWTWTASKIGISVGLGFISSNPVGWAIGIPTSQLIKLKGKENLNSSTLTFTDKEDAQRMIELATDYQWGAGLGIVGKGLGVIASEIANETLSIGRQASKEIAVNGFKTEVARNLITNGQLLSKIETTLKTLPNLRKLEERIKGLFNVIKEIGSSKKEEFIGNANILIQAQHLLITEIEKNLVEERNHLNNIRDNILSLNKENVNFFIKYENNKEEHRRVNREINTMLTIIKGLQTKLHTEGNCCDNCRFCVNEGGN